MPRLLLCGRRLLIRPSSNILKFCDLEEVLTEEYLELALVEQLELLLCCFRPRLPSCLCFDLFCEGFSDYQGLRVAVPFRFVGAVDSGVVEFLV
jgi:hypothetical protein